MTVLYTPDTLLCLLISTKVLLEPLSMISHTAYATGSLQSRIQIKQLVRLAAAWYGVCTGLRFSHDVQKCLIYVSDSKQGCSQDCEFSEFE